MAIREYNHRLRFGFGTEGSRDYYIFDELSAGPRVVFHSAAPIDGTWRAGDIVIDDSASAVGVGWKCTVSGPPGTWVQIGVAGGGGDSITVNTTAATDANFNDALPAAPAGSRNVRFQIDTATTPDNISANLEDSEIQAAQPPGDPDQSVQFNDGGTLFGGLDNVLNQDGANLRLVDTTAPGTPAIGSIVPYNFVIGASIPTRLAVVDGGTMGPPVYARSSRTRGVGWVVPDTTTTFVDTNGLAHQLVSGTLSLPAPTNTDRARAMKRWRLTTGGAANSPAEIRGAFGTLAANKHLWMGDAAGQGGFTISYLGVRFNAINTGLLGTRCILAVTTMTAFGGAATTFPTTFVSLVGFGFEDSDPNWSIWTSESALGTPGGVLQYDLGSGFPKDAGVYDFTIHCEANASQFEFNATRLDTADSQDRTVSVNLPDNIDFMSYFYHIRNSAAGGAAVAAAIDIRAIEVDWGLGY